MCVKEKVVIQPIFVVRVQVGERSKSGKVFISGLKNGFSPSFFLIEVLNMLVLQIK